MQSEELFRPTPEQLSLDADGAFAKDMDILALLGYFAWLMAPPTYAQTVYNAAKVRDAHSFLCLFPINSIQYEMGFNMCIYHFVTKIMPTTMHRCEAFRVSVQMRFLKLIAQILQL